MNQCRTVTSSHTSQIGRCKMIEFVTQHGILLSLIHIGISRTVDNAINVTICNKALHSLLITDVQFCNIGKMIYTAGISNSRAAHLIAQLTIGTRYEYILQRTINFHLSILIFQLSRSNSPTLSLA